MKTETRGPLAQWVHDELLSMSSQEFNVLMAKAREQDRKMAALVEALEAYERWEADLILSNEAWDGGAADYPTLTPELYGRLITIQGLRNAALAAVKGEPR